MRKVLANSPIGVTFSTLLTLLFAVAIGFVVINPVWAKLAFPGLFSSDILPPITAPIDGQYYIANAQDGYQWSTRNPLSLWFHPLLSVLLKLAPPDPPPNVWFWILSILFSASCLPLVFQLAKFISEDKRLTPWLIVLCLVAPGGLEIATGNAETPALFFSLGLVLSVLLWRKWWLTVLFAVFAILTKPNALYMVPVLLVYCYSGVRKHDRALWAQALLGVTAILVTWMAWMWLVDYHTGIQSAYWKVRLLERYYLDTGDIESFFQKLVDAFYDHNLRDQLRYSMALTIPCVNLVVIGLVPVKDESHRYAMAAGNLAMLAISLLLGNPNKIIVYTTTLPGHFAAHLLLLNGIIRKAAVETPMHWLAPAVLYSLYCLALMLFYVLGTPFAWYH